MSKYLLIIVVLGLAGCKQGDDAARRRSEISTPSRIHSTASHWTQSGVRDAPLSSADLAFVDRWLESHPKFRAATKDDYQGSDDLCTDEFQGYQFSADLNGDGFKDIAVTLVDTKQESDTNRFVVAVFNGPSYGPEPAYLSDDMNLSMGGLFFTRREGQASHILIGNCGSEGCFLQPSNSGYESDCGDD